MDTFFTQKTCDRCHKPLDGVRTMSRFNEDCICIDGAKAEQKHPRYQEAIDAERKAIQRGDYNFKGIGY